MDYDYDDTHEDYGGRILWGRFAFWGLALLLMFFLGRCSASDGAPQSELDAARAQVMELSSENETLKEELDNLRASTQQPPTETTDETEGDEEEPEATTRTYEVRSGDTLNGIAQRLCGGISHANAIAELNGLDSSNRLTVGQVLQLPPQCTSS